MASYNEEEYFAKETVEKLRKLHKDLQKQITPEQAAQLKATHANRCPSCGTEMQALPEYQGVTLLRCFNCGGAFVPPAAQQHIHKKHQEKEHAVVEAILNWLRHDEP